VPSRPRIQQHRETSQHSAPAGVNQLLLHDLICRDKITDTMLHGSMMASWPKHNIALHNSKCEIPCSHEWMHQNASATEVHIVIIQTSVQCAYSEQTARTTCTQKPTNVNVISFFKPSPFPQMGVITPPKCLHCKLFFLFWGLARSLQQETSGHASGQATQFAS